MPEPRYDAGVPSENTAPKSPVTVGKLPPVAERGTAWWLEKLRKRREREETLKLDTPIEWTSDEEQVHAVKFFNAAYRAEESGITQAHELAEKVAEWDEELAEVLRLYGDEEGWHRELLSEFLPFIGGTVEPMGRVTGTLFKLYGRAKRMETIILTNLMFETIGSTTYRLALRNVKHPSARQMLAILTRDEAFHVPLNLHFLKQILRRSPPSATRRVRVLYKLIFAGLVALPLASRPKSKVFDKVEAGELARAYAKHMAQLFADSPELRITPPKLLCWLLGVPVNGPRDPLLDPSSAAAERAADRSRVEVSAL